MDIKGIAGEKSAQVAGAILTRRGFLQVAGVAGALGLGAALAGCASGMHAAPTAASAAGSDVPGSADLAAAGSGAGSAADPLAGTAQDPDAKVITAVAPDDPYGRGLHHATIQIAKYGTIEVELNADVAPISTSNFCHLASDGFYDGLTFHRVIKDFMMQGGDPEGNGTGGAEKCVKGEFAANGVSNKLLHTRGALAMARSNDPDSGSSQFYIMQRANHDLDGNYAVFGHVTSGIEIVDQVCDKVPTTDDNGTVARGNQPRITSITVND